MRQTYLRGGWLGVSVAIASVWLGLGSAPALAQAPQSAKEANSAPSETVVSGGPIPIRVLVQSPAETNTELQVICLFRSEAANGLHGALTETNEKIKGLLDRVREPELFRGELGETLLIYPAAGSLGAKELLIIGLGDSANFSLERMDLVGSIVYREANRLGIAHPFFAPTILDGGVTKFGTGEVAEQVVSGFLRAMRTEKMLKDAGASPLVAVQDLTYLAGGKHASDTAQGIQKAIAAEGKR